MTIASVSAAPMVRGSRQFIEHAAPSDINKTISTYIAQLSAQQEKSHSAFAAKVLVYCLCATQEYDKASACLESHVGWLSAKGDWYMAVMEAEAAAHWASSHRLNFVARQMLRVVSNLYDNRIKSFDLEQELGRLEKNQDYGLALILLATARGERIRVSECVRRTGEYALGLLSSSQYSSDDKPEKQRWAEEVIRFCRNGDGAFSTGLALSMKESVEAGVWKTSERERLKVMDATLFENRTVSNKPLEDK